MKISGVYEIINTITGECYIGSSNNLKNRKRQHFGESNWKHSPNKPLYKDMKQYGKDNFLFKTIQLCNQDELKKYEQIAIEKYNPQYNVRAAYTGLSKEEYSKKYRKENIDRKKQYDKQYYKENSVAKKQYQKQHNKQYYKEHADSIKQQTKQYHNQQCLYENELLSLNALSMRFARKGIEHPVLEAKKYLIGE